MRADEPALVLRLRDARHLHGSAGAMSVPPGVPLRAPEPMGTALCCLADICRGGCALLTHPDSDRPPGNWARIPHRAPRALARRSAASDAAGRRHRHGNRRHPDLELLDPRPDDFFSRRVHFPSSSLGGRWAGGRVLARELRDSPLSVVQISEQNADARPDISLEREWTAPGVGTVGRAAGGTGDHQRHYRAIPAVDLADRDLEYL